MRLRDQYNRLQRLNGDCNSLGKLCAELDEMRTRPRLGINLWTCSNIDEYAIGDDFLHVLYPGRWA